MMTAIRTIAYKLLKYKRVESGTWRITNFNDSGQDETSDFTGYNFTLLRMER